MIKQTKIAILLLLLFTLFTGLIYPVFVTGIAQLFYPWRANGSLIEQNDQLIGSILIGQAFTDPKYFWSRPSATTPYPYNSENSSGSNLGPSNLDLLKAIQQRIDNLHQYDKNNAKLIPIDLITSSGSGLDPHISPQSAFYQVSRIARERGIQEEKVKSLILQHIKSPVFGILGEFHVNVLKLNIALDDLNSS